MQEKFLCRRAAPGDCAAVHRLVCELEQTPLPFGPFLEIYRSQLADPRYICLICEREGRPVGVLNLRMEPQLHHAGAVAEILEFAVAVPCRGQGAGRFLLAQACQCAREAGCVLIEAACNQTRVSAHRFYRREGMEATHLRFAKRLAEKTPED